MLLEARIQFGSRLIPRPVPARDLDVTVFPLCENQSFEQVRMALCLVGIRLCTGHMTVISIVSIGPIGAFGHCCQRRGSAFYRQETQHGGAAYLTASKSKHENTGDMTGVVQVVHDTHPFRVFCSCTGIETQPAAISLAAAGRRLNSHALALFKALLQGRIRQSPYQAKARTPEAATTLHCSVQTSQTGCSLESSTLSKLLNLHSHALYNS